MKTKTKVLLITLIAFVLLFAAAVAGLNAVFTVTRVDTEFVVCSETGREEAEELKEKLDRFVGRSTTFFKQSSVEKVVEEYPCFRVESFRKKFPETLKIVLVERKELFAFRYGDAYAVLDEEGVYLHGGENVNRTGGENILLNNFDFTVSADGTVSGKLFEETIAMFSAFSEMLPGIRASVVSVRFTRNARAPATSGNEFLIVTMREGVEIAIKNPSEGIAVKARAALTDVTDGYLNLPDERRITGAIHVGDLINGTAAVVYDSVLNVEEAK